MKQKKAILISMLVLICALVISIAVIKTFKSEDTEKTQNETTEYGKTEQLTTECEAPIEATPKDADKEKSEFEEFDINRQEEELTKKISESKHTYPELMEKGCKQLIIVSVSGTEAEVSMYEYNSGEYKKLEADCSGHVGSNGASDESYEGSRMTPVGMFSIGDAFYIENEPYTKLDKFHVTENTYWIDDPESELYNQRVELQGEKTWSSAEHMIDYSNAYKYGFVINFNMDPVVKGKGSAIFFHVGEQTTAGCVSVSQDNVLRILRLLDKEKNPHIIIYNEP